MTITAEKIQAGLKAGLEKARELNSPSSIAIVDEGRNLLGFVRMEGALLASVEISQAKAYTSRSLGCDTRDVDALAQPGGALFGIHTAHLAVGRALITFGGGVLVTVDGEPVGAIGVAGGTPDQDHEIAAAGAAVLAG